MIAMSSSSCVLVLVDFQARLMPAIHDAAAVTVRAIALAKAARAFGIPVVGTEENPLSLGQNVAEIRSLCASTVSKMNFDACADGLLDSLLAEGEGRSDVVVAGCEAHVCLLQTALGLLRSGRRVWVVENACGSRRPADHAAAMRRLAVAGATIVTHEMVLFEWLGGCRHPEFKSVLRLVKGAP